LFMKAAALLLWTTPRILIGFYLDLGDAANQSTVAIALQLFVIAALFQLFDGVQVIAAGALRGYRDTAVPMLIAAIGYWAIGFVGGWLLAFTFSFDEFIVAWFVSGFEQTLPVAVYAYIVGSVDPSLNAVGSIVFALSMLSLIGVELLLFPILLSQYRSADS